MANSVVTEKEQCKLCVFRCRGSLPGSPVWCTQYDALGHVWYGGQLWNGYDARSTVGGLARASVAPIAERGIVGRGILLDMARFRGQDNLDKAETFTHEDLAACALSGEIRSAFAMTEPDVASSDATNITTRMVGEGDDYVINGRKWWISGAADPRCQVFIVMGKTDPTAETHRQQSMILVPRDVPGMTIERQLPIFGYQDQHGHSEIVFRDVRVPASNMLAAEGDGFMIAQARLGPGRVHHAMRAIGMAERALGLMVDRAAVEVPTAWPTARSATGSGSAGLKSAGRPSEQLVDTAALALGRTAGAALARRDRDPLLAPRRGLWSM